MALAKSKIKAKNAQKGTGGAGARGRKRTKPLDAQEMAEAQKIVKFGGTDQDLALKFRLSIESAQDLFNQCQQLNGQSRGEFLEAAERRYQIGRSLLQRIEETTLIPLSREALMGLAEDIGIGVDYQFGALKDLTKAYHALIPVGMSSIKIEVNPENVYFESGHALTKVFGYEDPLPVFPDTRTRLEALKLLGKSTGLESSARFSILERAKAIKEAEDSMKEKDSGAAYQIISPEKDDLPEETWMNADDKTPEL
jgi:hypothetical protein